MASSPDVPSGASISVAMCTCNGGLYVREQLESIAAQKRLPNELVICDDCSTDDTIAVIRDFASRSPFPVRWQINPCRLGSSANFAKALGLCRGDWILLADQDDAWVPHKISRILDSAAARPEVAMWFSDAVMVNPRRQPLGYRLWDAISMTRWERSQIERGNLFEVLLRRNVVSGLTVALRAEFRNMILPIPKGWVHDGWIALLVAAVAPCGAIAEPLVEYRQHPNQQIGEAKRSLYQQYLRAKQRGPSDIIGVADNFLAARERLTTYGNRLRTSDLLEMLDTKVDHLRARALARLGQRRRWMPVIDQLLRGNYGRFSYGWKSVARDLFV
jgi:glycosyltransferase involved in cell wall biosynthesis